MKLTAVKPGAGLVDLVRGSNKASKLRNRPIVIESGQINTEVN
jgi:hypothetical protein